MTAQDTADTNRRTVLKSTGAVMGAGAAGYFSTNTVVAEEKNPEEAGLLKGESSFIETKLEISDLPDEALRVCGEPELYPFNIGEEDRIFISKLDQWGSINLESEFILAQARGNYSSREIGSTISQSEDKIVLRSNEGTIIGEIQDRLELVLTDPEEATIRTEGQKDTVQAGEEATVAEDVTIKYRVEGEEKEFSTEILFTVVNRGDCSLIAHPEHKIYPPNHRNASSYERMLKKQKESSKDQIKRERDIVRIARDTEYGSYIIDREFRGGEQ